MVVRFFWMWLTPFKVLIAIICKMWVHISVALQRAVNSKLLALTATRAVLPWAGRLNWPASLSGLFSSFLLETMVTVALMRILSALLLALSPLSQYWEVIMWQGDLQHAVIGNVVNTWWVGCVFNTSSSFLFRYNVSPQLLFSSQYGLKGSQLS